MEIRILAENTTKYENLIAEHGLSVYGKSGEISFLADFGQSESTWKNAELLGIDLAEIQLAFLSHAHYDHSGGLFSFAQINKTAPIYMSRYATAPCYNIRDDRYIGVDRNIFHLPQIKYVEECRIDKQFSVFAVHSKNKYIPRGNRILGIQTDNGIIADDFRHELNLVFEENNKYFLYSGCAHNGILNILDSFESIYHCQPDYVFGGFHLMKKTEYDKSEIEEIQDLARELKHTKTKFYTGHCTGLPAYDILKNILGEQLCCISCGDIFTL